MSWSDFTHAKHFGNGIYRPYSDFLGDMSVEVDNLLANLPTLAKFSGAVHQRDIVFVVGSNVSLLVLSRGLARHLPFYEVRKWEETITIQESDFLQTKDTVITVPRVLQSEQMVNHFSGNESFTDPLILVLPSIFTPRPDTEDTAMRAHSVSLASRLLVNWLATEFNRIQEMNKPKRIFLSHKSSDKSLVREVSATLTAIGFSPWLDEDEMKAGANLERSLRTGFSESCAAVFFITPSFSDEGFLASEIDYAISEKRTKGEKFSIITLLLADGEGHFGEVPLLLKTYVWKQIPQIAIIRSIVEALPIKLESEVWR